MHAIPLERGATARLTFQREEGGGGGGEWRARPFMSVPYLEPEPRDFLSPVTGTKKERVDPRLHYGQPMGVNTTVAALKD